MKKPRRSLGPREDVIQTQLARFLVLACKPGVVWCHIPNGGSRNKIEAARLKAQGVKPGVPDLMFIHDGHPYFLELKRERGGVVSADQTIMHDDLRKAGATVGIARGLSAAVDLLQEWELVRSPR